MVPSTGETQLRGLVALDLCLAVGYLAIGTTFQSPVLHGSVFRWPGCSSRISHTVCHLAFKLKIKLEDFWENYPEIS